MPTQSNLQFAAVPPSVVPTPTTGYYAFFVGDGTSGTTTGVYYKKDAAGNVTALLPPAYTTQNAQDAVGSILTATSTVSFAYDGTGHTITATVPDGSITIAKLANMPSATIRGRQAGTAGTPQDLTPAQAKAVLGVTYSDVSGLGSAAQANASAFDSAGAATAAQAASQPLDSDLTAIAALATTAYGRALLTLADQNGLQGVVGAVSTTASGLLAASDYNRLLNINVGRYNVRDYGIQPSNTGAVNLAAWNTLMSTVVDNGTVYFPPGPNAYQFSDTCAIPAGKHLRVEGGGQEKTLIQTTNATSHIFTCGDWYQEFRGLKLTTSVTRTAGAGIYSGNNVAINIYDCDFMGMWDAIVYSGGANAANLTVVSNVSITNNYNRGVTIDGQNANAILEKIIIDSPAGQNQVGLELLQCGSVLVSNCDFIRATNNCRFNPSGSNGVFSAYFLNVFFDTAGGSSVMFTNTGNIQRVKFTNCWFSGSVTGCEFASTATTLPTAIDFIGCDIFGNSSRGIYGHGVQDFAATNCRIAGNTTAGVELVASAASATKMNLTSNVIGPTAGFGANGTGIIINAGTYGGYSVKNNDLRGNTTFNLADAGTVATSDLKVINDNIGHIITGSIGNITAPVATTAATDTALLSARVPGNASVIGQIFRFKLIGISSSTGTLIFRVHAGSAGTTADTTVWQSITSAGQVANQRAGFDGTLSVRSIGATGTVQCEALGFAQAALLPTLVAAVATPTVNTATPWFITLSVTVSTGTFTAQQAVTEAL